MSYFNCTTCIQQDIFRIFIDVCRCIWRNSDFIPGLHSTRKKAVTISCWNIVWQFKNPTLCIVSDKILSRDAIMQADNPASHCALEAGGAGGLCGGIDADRCSFPLSVSGHVICSRPSLNHPFTRSLTHSTAHSPAHCSSQTGRPASLAKYQHCPLLVGLISHLDRMMSHLKNDCTEQFLTLTLSHWFINLLWEKRKRFFYRETTDKGWRLMYFCLAWLGYISDWITATQGLLLRHSHFTSARESQWNSACERDGAGLESRGEGNYPLWSLGDDMSLCDSFCYFDRREEK